MENIVTTEEIEDTELTDDEKSSVAALAAKPAQDEFELMEKADEALVLQELAGEVESTVKESWFYKLPSGAVGISWIGIKAYKNRCAEMGYPINVDIEPVEFTERVQSIYEGIDKGIYTSDEAKKMLKPFLEEVHFKATAVDTRTGQEATGIANQPLKEYQRGKMVDDKFAMRKAASKAKRNAIEELMTAQVKAQLLLIAMRQGYKPQELKPATRKSKAELLVTISKLSSKERIDAYLTKHNYQSLNNAPVAQLKAIIKKLKGER